MYISSRAAEWTSQHAGKKHSTLSKYIAPTDRGYTFVGKYKIARQRRTLASVLSDCVRVYILILRICIFFIFMYFSIFFILPSRFPFAIQTKLICLPATNDRLTVWRRVEMEVTPYSGLK